MPSDPPKVFISYTHDAPEHKARVLALADRLCSGGVDVQLDQYESAPQTTWPRWMEDGIERADFVLVVATETYARRYRGHEAPGTGLGAQWEGAVITQALYDAAVRNTKFIAVIFEPDDQQHIPSVLRGFTWHDIGDDAGYDGLYKSALINRWLDGVAADGWRGARRVFGWSFYSQGLTAPWEKGRELARLVRAERTLLVLDGLEPLQHPPGVQRGRLKDPALQALVRELAVKNPGLCVISTRLAVADVAGRGGAVAVDLERLPAAAGAALLKQLGVEGSEAELEEASRELDGHGLALTLLGTWPIAAATPSCGWPIGRSWPTPCTKGAGGRRARRPSARPRRCRRRGSRRLRDSTRCRAISIVICC